MCLFPLSFNVDMFFASSATYFLVYIYVHTYLDSYIDRHWLYIKRMLLIKTDPYMTMNGSKKRVQQFLNVDVFLIPDYIFCAYVIM